MRQVTCMLICILMIIMGSAKVNVNVQTDVNTKLEDFTTKLQEGDESREFNNQSDALSYGDPLKQELARVVEQIYEIKDKLKIGTATKTLNATEISNYKHFLVKLIFDKNDIQHQIRDLNREDSNYSSVRPKYLYENNFVQSKNVGGNLPIVDEKNNGTTDMLGENIVNENIVDIKQKLDQARNPEYSIGESDTSEEYMDAFDDVQGSKWRGENSKEITENTVPVQNGYGTYPMTLEQDIEAVPNSFQISADNQQAKHRSHNEYTVMKLRKPDEKNELWFKQGIPNGDNSKPHLLRPQYVALNSYGHDNRRFRKVQITKKKYKSSDGDTRGIVKHIPKSETKVIPLRKVETVKPCQRHQNYRPFEKAHTTFNGNHEDYDEIESTVHYLLEEITEDNYNQDLEDDLEQNDDHDDSQYLTSNHGKTERAMKKKKHSLLTDHNKVGAKSTRNIQKRKKSIKKSKNAKANPNDKASSARFLFHMVHLFPISHAQYYKPVANLTNSPVQNKTFSRPASGIVLSVMCLLTFVSIITIVITIINFCVNDPRAKNIFSFHSR